MKILDPKNRKFRKCIFFKDMFSEKTKTPKTFQFLPVDAAENLFKKMVISLRKKIEQFFI